MARIIVIIDFGLVLLLLIFPFSKYLCFFLFAIGTIYKKYSLDTPFRGTLGEIVRVIECLLFSKTTYFPFLSYKNNKLRKNQRFCLSLVFESNHYEIIFNTNNKEPAFFAILNC